MSDKTAGGEGDPFLIATRVQTEEAAMRNAIQAALQRNKTYSSGSDNKAREVFRAELAKQLRGEARAYTLEVSEGRHCAAIRRIADDISQRCRASLQDGRLRFGTAQKAFNLYLKFLWKLDKIAKPPHCPVDSIVLRQAGILGSWTKSDCETEYLRWIARIKCRAKPHSVSEWEDSIWIQGRPGVQQ